MVAEEDLWIEPSGRVVIVVVVESNSPRSVVMIFWCSTEPSGSVIVLFVVVVGPILILTAVQVWTPPFASWVVPLTTVRSGEGENCEE